jgi:glycosyltransferase involved in cell wall biosynthesis
MRIGVLYKPEGWNVAYRAQGPAEALRARGHDVRVVVRANDDSFDPQPFMDCDIVHIYRLSDDGVRRLVDGLHARGVAVSWDNDDDVRLIPTVRRRQLKLDQYKIERAWQSQVKMMRRADVVTTTTEYLADAFASVGASRVVRIENYLFDAQYQCSRPSRDRLLIGWVAAAEHEADDQALRVSQNLRQALERHPALHVVTIGLALHVDHARYERLAQIPLRNLNEQVRRFDIAIAPLADIPMSYARSNVKVKEYAAAGVPWLASARGPYAGLGAAQGGMVVEDGDWQQAFDTLLGSRLKRWRLRRNATSWAKTQSIERHVDKWERAFEEAIEAAGKRARAGVASRRSQPAAG